MQTFAHWIKIWKTWITKEPWKEYIFIWDIVHVVKLYTTTYNVMVLHNDILLKYITLKITTKQVKIIVESG